MRAARLLERALPAGHRALGPSADAIVAAHALNLALELVGKRRRSMLRWAAALATRASTRGAPARPSRLVAAVARLHLGDRRGARRLLDALDIATLPPDRDLLPALVNLTDLAIACRDGAQLDVIHRRLKAHAGLRVCRDFADWGDVLYHAARAARGLGLEAERQRLTKMSFAREPPCRIATVAAMGRARPCECSHRPQQRCRRGPRLAPAGANGGVGPLPRLAGAGAGCAREPRHRPCGEAASRLTVRAHDAIISACSGPTSETSETAAPAMALFHTAGDE